MTMRRDIEDDLDGDILSTLGLVLNFAAVICLALWLSMAGGASRTGSPMIAGLATIILFGASIICFAVDQPDRQPQGDVQPLGATPAAVKV